MPGERLTTRRQGAVGVIELGHPPHGLSLDDIRRFTAAIGAAQNNPEVSVILIVGTAGAFCAGGDLSDFLACADLDELAGVVSSFLRTLAFAEKPLFAAVDGPAVGLGMTMLLHFDAVFATPHSTFNAPFSELGLIPEAGATLLAPLRFGYLKAFEMLCVGRSFSAAEAQAMGLITEVTDDANERALLVAARMARKPKVALQKIRSLLRGNLHDIEQRIDVEVAEFRARLEDASTVRRLGRLVRAANRPRSAAA